MSQPDFQVHLQRLNKIKKIIKTNCTSLITQGPKINDLLLTVIEECLPASDRSIDKGFGYEKSVEVEFCCWDFLFVYCSSFGKLVSLSAGDLKVLMKQLKGYIEVKDATVELQEKNVVLKKKRKQSPVVEETEMREPDSETWSLHHAALKALNALLIATCDNIEESEHRELSQVTVRQLLDIYCKQDDLTGVYTVLELREDLLRLLRTLILFPNSVRPIQPAQAIFMNALNWEQDSDLKLFCRESLLVFNLIVRPTLPVEIVLHSRTATGDNVDIGPGDTEDIGVSDTVDTGVSETVDTGAGNETERNHFEDRGAIDNDGETGGELVNGSGTGTECAVDEVITITDDSQDVTAHDQTHPELSSDCPILPIHVKEATISPSPGRVEDRNQSILSVSGSSNYVTANDSTLTGSHILSPESDYMEILDELS